MVMVVAISLFEGVFFLRGIGDHLVEVLQKSVNITAYFIDTATEDKILQARQEILTWPGVKSVEYISKDTALERFKAIHQEDPITQEILESVGENPLLASLDIQTHDFADYRFLNDSLTQAPFADLVSEVDYYDRETVIQLISKVAQGIERGILLVSVFGALVAILVVFNTIRLTMHNSKEEIEVMRLVGASHWFVRGPFLVQGILVGILASAIAFILSFAALFFFSPKLALFIPGFNIFEFFLNSLSLVLLIELGAGIGLGVVSALIAIRKYLNT